MTLRDPVLMVHIAAGVAGLALGPLAMVAPARRRGHTRAGSAYHWAVLVVCLSAAGLALMRWDELWWFVLLAAFSYALALRGDVAARRRRPGWRRDHITGVGGSYIALVTALLVVSSDGAIVTWLLPSLIGAPVIHLVRARAARHAGAAVSRPARATRRSP
jgi:hypothetical protein